MRKIFTTLISILFPQKQYLAKCGHMTKRKADVTAFGRTTTIEILSKEGEIEYCHECLQKMTIKCAWCGEPIFVGDIITLYSPANKDFIIPEHAVVYSQEHHQLVGCGRTTCADSGCDYCGHWYPPGKVQRFASAIEIAMANPGCAVMGSHHDGERTVDVIPLGKH